MFSKGFQQRSLTGILFGLAVLALLWWGIIGIRVLLGTIAVFCALEGFRMLSPLRSSASFILSVILILPLIGTLAFNFSADVFCALIALATLMSLFPVLFFRPSIFVPSLFALGAIVILIVFPLFCGHLILRQLGTEAQAFYFVVILLIWANDVFAYLIGSRFGRTPLAVRLSPKKTWEGTLGGATMTLILGVSGYFFLEIYPLTIWIAVGICVGLFGTLGDLLQSAVKRYAGAKDSGGMLPGHGGFWDRFDSLLGILPFLTAFVLLFLRS